MVIHHSSCLEGPMSTHHDWWREETPETAAEELRQEGPEDRSFRADLVARVRRQIARGEYDTPERWEAALDRLLQRLESD